VSPGDPLTQILLNIGLALLILLVALVVAGLAKRWVVRILVRTTSNANVATLVGNLVQVGIILVGIVTALPVVGVQWASLVALVGAAGLAISLSMQDLLKNVVAGIYILMEQPFRIGDRISVKDVTGVVQGIELRTTILRTDEHLQVVVPNNTVLTEIITNRSANSLVRTTVQMRVRRGDVPDLYNRVKTVVAGVEGVAETPSSDVAMDGVFEGVERHKINFWAPTGKKAEVTLAVMEALQSSFPEANLKVVT
jgi:small-conductance mechanosensitive channel